MLLAAIFFLFLLLGLTAVFTLVWLSDSVFGGLDFSTGNLAVLAAGKIIKQFHKEEGTLCDLGSARGNFVFKISAQCPRLRLYGVDNNGLRIFFSRCKSVIFPGPSFIKKDLFLANVSKYDVVYMYLDKDLLPKLEQKLQKEMKIGSIAITNAQSFSNWQSALTVVSDIKNPEHQKLFVYVKN